MNVHYQGYFIIEMKNKIGWVRVGTGRMIGRCRMIGIGGGGKIFIRLFLLVVLKFVMDFRDLGKIEDDSAFTKYIWRFVQTIYGGP